MHKLLRYAKNVLRYAVIITLCGNYYVMRRHTRTRPCVRIRKGIIPESILVANGDGWKLNRSFLCHGCLHSDRPAIELSHQSLTLVA